MTTGRINQVATSSSTSPSTALRPSTTRRHPQVSPPAADCQTHSARERAACFQSEATRSLRSESFKIPEADQAALSSRCSPPPMGTSCCLLASFLDRAIVELPQQGASLRGLEIERIAGPLRALRDSMPSVRGAPGFTPNLRIRGRAVARAVSRHRFADNAGHCLRTRRFRSSPRTPCRLRSRDSDGRLSSARCSELRRGRVIRRGSPVLGAYCAPRHREGFGRECASPRLGSPQRGVAAGEAVRAKKAPGAHSVCYDSCR